MSAQVGSTFRATHRRAGRVFGASGYVNVVSDATQRVLCVAAVRFSQLDEGARERVDDRDWRDKTGDNDWTSS